MKKISEGKVRNIYDLEDGRLVLVTSDRISAFDAVLPNLIPNKGAVLNRLSSFWFERTKNIVPNHMISINNADMPEYFQKPEFYGRCMLVRKLKMFPIECIVRGYLTGSGWSSYQKDGTVCGAVIPAGIQESEKLSEPIYTPTTKAVTGHDEPISISETIKLIGNDAISLMELSMGLYMKCAEYAKKKGIIIADTKFEFGLDTNGNIVLADEVLTPDSSRFWPLESYEVGKSQKSFDKQFVRDWLKRNWDGTKLPPALPFEVVQATSAKYIEAYKALSGEDF